MSAVTNGPGITGKTASEIVESVRNLVDVGAFKPGDLLPPVRQLAVEIGVNRNTAVAAYRQLALAGLVESKGRAGTRVLGLSATEEEGFTPGSVLRDIADGNPDRRYLPDPSTIQLEQTRPRLYGEEAIDPQLADWGREWFSQDLSRPFQLTVTGGAIDAIERLLQQSLSPGDAVALEDPCFLTSVGSARVNGYRVVPVSMDHEGMVPASLRAALETGVRAVVYTPRAHNPTGVSLSADRAHELQAVLSGFPHVLVIEDDHFAMLSTNPYRSIVSAKHQRWAVIRTLSKTLGPDMRIAVVASDVETEARLARRLSGGIHWISHILQRLAHHMLASPEIQALVSSAREHYSEINASFAQALEPLGLASSCQDGLNVWVEFGDAVGSVYRTLMQRGWLPREGRVFALNEAQDEYLRFTVHSLNEEERGRLIHDIREACQAAA